MLFTDAMLAALQARQFIHSPNGQRVHCPTCGAQHFASLRHAFLHADGCAYKDALEVVRALVNAKH